MYSVIIVDDESSACEIIKSFIDTNIQEFSVLETFYSSSDAFSYLLINRVDVIITDISMPVMNGVEMTRKLRENNINSKIIFISGYDDFGYAKKAIEYGVFNYLLKPVDFSELKQSFKRIKELLDNSVSSKDNLSDFIIKIFTAENSEIANEVRADFEQYELPSVLKQFTGHILRLKLKRYEEYIRTRWNYDNDTIDDLIMNIIRMSVPDSYVAQLYNKSGVYLFVVFCDDTQDLVSRIVIALKNVLPFEFQLKNVYSFSGIEDARMFNVLNNEILCENQKNTVGDLVDEIKEYLKRNYAKNISLSELSEIFHMNAVYLARVFKQNTGVSPYEYHLNERMNKAVGLLVSGHKIEYITHVLGYVDRRSFYRNFKNHTGYSPGEYRDTMLKMEFD